MKKEPIVIKIRNLRQGRDLTQEALAEALGISRQSIIALENGRYMPSLPLACEMAKFFEVALDELFSFENQILSLNANEEDTMKNRVLSPWLGVRSIQEEMDRFFEEGMPAVDRSISLPAVPQVNIRQDEKNIYVEAPIPGYKEDDLDIDVAEEYLTITGKVNTEDESKKKGYFRQEYAYQSFARTIPFPVPVDAEAAEAEVENGVLTITVPKAEPEKPKTKKLAIKKK